MKMRNLNKTTSDQTAPRNGDDGDMEREGAPVTNGLSERTLSLSEENVGVVLSAEELR